jgi:hypothetical protein
VLLRMCYRQGVDAPAAAAAEKSCRCWHLHCCYEHKTVAIVQRQQ